MGKPNGRLLLTWNEQKHPEVVEFFNSIEQGLYSHYVREAIKFYMEHKGKENEKSSTEDYKNSLQVEHNNDTIETESEKNSDEYVTFNPDDI